MCGTCAAYASRRGLSTRLHSISGGPEDVQYRILFNVGAHHLAETGPLRTELDQITLPLWALGGAAIRGFHRIASPPGRDKDFAIITIGLPHLGIGNEGAHSWNFWQGIVMQMLMNVLFKILVHRL